MKKDKDLSNPGSYRLVSLTNNISKIFEKIIKINLIDHIDTNKIIPDNQFGFRTRHSTTHDINKLASDINSYILNGKLVGAILLDLEKAFDFVWLNRLTYQLVTLDFPRYLIQLITDMMHGKSFYTWNGKDTSTYIFKKIEGLQQGTVTSPILDFRLNTKKFLHSIAYADDLLYYFASNKIPEIQKTLKNILDSINKYYLDWNLKINPQKSEAILFKKTVDEITYQTVKKNKDFKITMTDQETREETEIPSKSTVEYLGVKFDYRLRMNEHHKTQIP